MHGYTHVYAQYSRLHMYMLCNMQALINQKKNMANMYTVCDKQLHVPNNQCL